MFLQGANLLCLFAYNDLFLTLPSFLIQDTVLSNPQQLESPLLSQTDCNRPTSIPSIFFLTFTLLIQRPANLPGLFVSSGKARKEKTSGLQNRVQPQDPKQRLWILNSLLQHRRTQARTLEKTNQGRNQQGAPVQWIADSTLSSAQPRLIASLYPLHPLKMPWKQATQEHCCSYHSYQIGRPSSLSAQGQELTISCAPFTLPDGVQL